MPVFVGGRLRFPEVIYFAEREGPAQAETPRRAQLVHTGGILCSLAPKVAAEHASPTDFAARPGQTPDAHYVNWITRSRYWASLLAY